MEGSGQGALTNANYTVGATTNGTFTVGQRALAIAAADKDRAAGTATPPLTYQIGGMCLIDGDSPAGTTASAAARHAGVSPRGTTSLSSLKRESKP